MRRSLQQKALVPRTTLALASHDSHAGHNKTGSPQKILIACRVCAQVLGEAQVNGQVALLSRAVLVQSMRAVRFVLVKACLDHRAVMSSKMSPMKFASLRHSNPVEAPR